MRRTFFDILILVMPLTGLTFGVMVYTLMLHWHANGIMLSAGLGLLCGTVFGTAAGWFIRTLEYEAEVEGSIDMSRRVELALLDMGYRMEYRHNKVVTFRPMLRAGLFADRIRIELMSARLRIEGPCLHVDQLVARLGI